MKVTVDKKRHILKTITWRLIATSFTFLAAWIITGSIEFGLGIGLVDIIGKTALYYFHERCWYKYTNFGVKRNE